jgi:hypothetical protein
VTRHLTTHTSDIYQGLTYLTLQTGRRRHSIRHPALGDRSRLIASFISPTLSSLLGTYMYSTAYRLINPYSTASDDVTRLPILT